MRRTLLIVDDEPLSVEGLRAGLDWSGLGMTEVLTAGSLDQAVWIFRERPIDILLCDIEMPHGTGLQLLEWVKEHSPGTETVFLTCHAEFQYARQAVQLGSFDYLLKPIPFEELEKVIRKVAVKLDEQRHQSEYSRYGEFWVRHQPMLVEKFWLDIMSLAIPGTAAEIAEAAAERNIPYSSELLFRPLLVRIRRWEKAYSLRERKTMEYALRKAGEELILQRPDTGILVSARDDCMLAILTANGKNVDEADLKRDCEAYIEACSLYFHCDICCYIGEEARGHEMGLAYQRLLQRDAENVTSDNRAFLSGEKTADKGPFALPDMSLWAVMLKEGVQSRVVEEAEAYLDKQAREHRLTPDLLMTFIYDYQQMVLYVLQLKDIQAHRLLEKGEPFELRERAVASAKDATVWIRHITGRALELAKELENAQGVVEQAKRYIRQYISETITREEIAGHVYLNPDYLTRIFKRETGLSISDYLLQQRLGIAAELLESTDLPVSAIAGRIGYANFSHFSRMFKKYMQLNPLEYRQQRQRGTGTAGSRQNASGKS